MFSGVLCFPRVVWEALTRACSAHWHFVSSRSLGNPMFLNSDYVFPASKWCWAVRWGGILCRMEGHIGGAVGKVSRGTRAFTFTEQRSQDPGQNPALAWLPAPLTSCPQSQSPLTSQSWVWLLEASDPWTVELDMNQEPHPDSLFDLGRS